LLDITVPQSFPHELYPLNNLEMIHLNSYKED